MNAAVRTERLGKMYRVNLSRERRSIHRYKTIRETIASGARDLAERATGRGPDTRAGGHADFWALRDVDLELPLGEAVGIIGPNGAGKTTLLKILSRITTPTTGVAYVRGRIGALLELGTGFHPELTGRENIYLSAAILGMRKADIDRRLDSIVEFAELQDFLELPVKRYSPGMYARLGFSVAAHLEPDILVVDEVLSVGDASFQRKCLGRMNAEALGGRTVLFVSHNLASIRQLTTRCVRLEGGRVVAQGATADIVAGYLRDVAATAGERGLVDLREPHWRAAVTKVTPRDVSFRSVRLFDRTGATTTVFNEHEPVGLELTIEAARASSVIEVIVPIRTLEGFLVGTAMSGKRPAQIAPGTYRIACHIDAELLVAGHYQLDLGLWTVIAQDIVPRVATFEVVGDPEPGDDPRLASGGSASYGPVRVRSSWSDLEGVGASGGKPKAPAATGSM